MICEGSSLVKLQVNCHCMWSWFFLKIWFLLQFRLQQIRLSKACLMKQMFSALLGQILHSIFAICFLSIYTVHRNWYIQWSKNILILPLLPPIFLCPHPEYEIVSPYEVDQQGVYISHEVAHHQRRRRRRSLTPGSSDSGSGSETVHFRLRGLGQDFHMELREASDSLIAPGFTIQVLGKNGTKSLRAYHQDDLCFYQGSLRSRVNSSVALSTCMGMVSLNMHRVGLREISVKMECGFASAYLIEKFLWKCVSQAVLIYCNVGNFHTCQPKKCCNCNRLLKKWVYLVTSDMNTVWLSCPIMIHLILTHGPLWI